MTAETRSFARLLVGSREFWEDARSAIAAAKERVLVQAMTFEGDATGLDVARAIERSSARDRRVLVDAYSTVIVSDRLVMTPGARRDLDFQNEVRETRAMFERVVDGGGRVRVTNALGPLGVRFPQRNHKKLVIADDAVYVGGINFSDHNFAWHDLMVRVDRRDVADHLAADFDATFEGAPRSSEAHFTGVSIHSLDGRDNAAGFTALFRAIEHAKRSITVVSPYLTFPFVEPLVRAGARGVEVVVLTPRGNNKGMVRDYLLWEAARFGLDLRLFPGMSHMKAMLIDEERLVVGSSNFDFVSYVAQDELVAIFDDVALATDFRRRVLDPDLARAEPAPAIASRARGLTRFAALKVAERGARLSRTLAPPARRAPPVEIGRSSRG